MMNQTSPVCPPSAVARQFHGGANHWLAAARRQLLCFLAAAIPGVAAAAPGDSMITGSERGTYIQIGRDLARLVAKPAGIELDVLPSKGSVENVRRLRGEAGVRLALVQSDVYQALMDEAEAGNAKAADLIKPLRVVLPLYDEEIYFVVRADSPLNHIHEIRGKRISVGPVGSGTAQSATTLYRQMFGTAISAQNASFLSNEDGLRKLVTDRSVDVVVVVAGQPAKLFSDMTPEARRYIKLLRLDPRAAPSQAAAATYAATAIRGSSYPSWLREDVPTFTTQALLVTYNYQGPGTRDMLTRFADSLCSNFASLKANGHAKWQEVNLNLPALGRGWSYYTPTANRIASCSAMSSGPAASVSPAAPAAAPACDQSRQVLGLCNGL
jgi:hypothetical protein